MMCKAILARQSPICYWTQGFTRGILIIVLREERLAIYLGAATRYANVCFQLQKKVNLLPAGSKNA
jgi:hypothetical protein